MQMAPAILQRVCRHGTDPFQGQNSPLTFTHAILHKHTRHKVRYCDFPAVIPSSHGSSVRGTYVRGLTDRDIRLLDIFEGDEYVRKMVTIRTLAHVGKNNDDDHDDNDDDAGIQNVEEAEEAEEVETETYIWAVGEDALEECEWDFAEFKRDKLSSWLSLDDHYAGGSRHFAGNCSQW